MINTLSLLIGLFGILLVAIRAMVADRTLPWFKPAPLKPPVVKARPGAIR